MKKCIKCMVVKPLDEYYDSQMNKDKKFSRCKPCVVAYSQQRYKRVYVKAPKAPPKPCISKDGKDYSQRKYYKKFKKNFCEVCGFVPIDPCQLDVDHVDGNRYNHSPENLRTLCANCHRLKTKQNKDTLGRYNL